jgi:hypothetical protein
VPIEKSILGVAGEFAVAAELCRRNIYAQLTLGHRKRTDLLVVGENGRMFRIEVKAKQGRDWPACRGISDKGSFLVFVDFADKSVMERPDFYVLTVGDWRTFLKRAVARYRKDHPDRRVKIRDDNVVVFEDERNRYDKPYEGCGVKAEDIQSHKEVWGKLNCVRQRSSRNLSTVRPA